MKYSVIVPVYNAQTFLRECLDSVISQKRNDVELILINDGSKDDSLKICRDYQKRYPNIEVIDKDNSGSLDSYIVGVIAAKGKYICFLDSDDLLERNYFNSLDNIVEHYDIVIFDFYRMYKDKKIPMKINEIPHGTISAENLNLIQKHYFSNYKLYSFYRWDKVIRADIVKDSVKQIRSRAVYFEDIIIGLLNVLSARKVYYLDEKLYFYRMRKGSVSKSVNSKNFSDNLEVESEVKKIAIKNSYSQYELKKLHLYFAFQYARLAMRAKDKPKRIKITVKDIQSIIGIEKKLTLLLYKLHLDSVFNVLNTFRHLKKQDEVNYF